MDHLQQDAAIARTASGSLIAGGKSPQLDLGAVLYVTDLLLREGYLRAGAGDEAAP